MGETFSGCSNGLQFAPNIDGDDLKVYDPHTLEIVTYTKSESQKQGSEKLQIDLY
jgi:hypothetical protein